MQKIRGMTAKLFIDGVEDVGFDGDRYSILAQSLINDDLPDRSLRRFVTIRSLFLLLQFRLFVVKSKALLSLLKPESKPTLRSLVKFWNYLVETWNEANTKR